MKKYFNAAIIVIVIVIAVSIFVILKVGHKINIKNSIASSTPIASSSIPAAASTSK